MNSMTQIKFTIDSNIVSTFKAGCVAEGVSMTSIIRQWMCNHNPENHLKLKTLSRPSRRKAVTEIISLLYDVLEMEEQYRDSIPEQFAQRYERSDHACVHIAEAIETLEDAFCA